MIYGKIYKLVSEHTDKIYIGSTTLSLSKRLMCHKYDSKLKRECTSKFLFDLGEVEIILIEDFECEDKKDLKIEERRITELHNNTVNEKKAYLTKDEYHEMDRKKDIKYKINNKEKIAKRRKLSKLKKKFPLACPELLECMLIKI